MPTETVHFENPRLAQQLFNHEPRNLQALETELAVKAVAREDWIKLEGAVEDIARARDMFHLLEKSLKAGGVVRNREFAQALSVVKNDGVAALRTLLAERILTSPRKAAVLPKTIGQKKYVDAIRAHDVTFGIGPAGTGKTYLAMAMALSALQEEKVARIILTRPAVEAGEALGFLPGDLYEKITPYLRPLHDALHDMLPAEEIQKQMERGVIEIAPMILAVLFVFSGCSAAPHTKAKAGDPVMNTLITTSVISTTTTTTPVVSPPGIPPFDQSNWKITQVQAIATASQYLPANVVSQAMIEANMEAAGNLTTGEPNYYWDVAFENISVTQAELGWQSDSLTTLNPGPDATSTKSLSE